jgi:hypothetical protein
MLSSRLAGRLGLRVALIALSIAASVALAACGDDGTTTTSTSPTTSSGATTGSGDQRQAFDAALRKSLAQAGVGAQRVDCVVSHLHRTLPDSQVQAIISGQASKALTDAVFKTGRNCLNH